MLPQCLWALVVSLLLAALPTRAQTTQRFTLDTPVILTGNNFTTTSTPVLFSLPSSSTSSQVTISLALCAAASNNPPRVFVSNSSGSQVVPGPNGGVDVYEVQI